MQNKVLGCLGIGAVVLLVISLVANVALFFGMMGAVSMGGGSAGTHAFQEELHLKGDGQETRKIAHIDLEGMITGIGGNAFGGSMVDTMKKALRQAEKDDDVVAVVLRVNSPGGEVTASDTIYNAVRQLAEKKPVVVFMDALAASGGYYIACGATKIVANETTITGSIGVIMAAPNYTELMEKVGLDMMVFKSGAFKDTMRGSREMRPDEQEYMQGQVDEMYEKFIGIVADERGLPLGNLRGGLADGRIFSGAEAAKNGLVDATGYIEDAYDLAKEESGVAGARIVRYHTLPSLAGLLGILGKSPADGGATKVQIDLDGGLLPDLAPGYAYMLPGYLVP